MIGMRRFRFWAYPDGTIVEIPVDAPDTRPPTRLEDVPATWNRTKTAGPAPVNPKARRRTCP
ncbi:hypothetical protein [Yinghuangia sp. YIM S09857]|uniref:hypothetical protein n=1 Tax=Yinghuangia sp. YIM S09857 TaxID=3436929 RepID=UPI003F533FAB